MNKFKYQGLIGFILLCALQANVFAKTEAVEIQSEQWQLKGTLSIPDGQSPKAIVMMFHKAAGNRSEYDNLSKKLLKVGIATLAMDLRGHGQSINIDKFDYKVKKNHAILQGTEKDVANVHRFVKSDKRFAGLPIGNISASYSGEFAAQASKLSGFADAYVQLSPGSISSDSIKMADVSGVPWLFVRAKIERSFFDAIFEDIKVLSKTAETRIVPGKSHATRLLKHHPPLEDELVDWFKAKLVSQ